MDRNPFVLLGIPFGSSRDVATSAFARRAKKLRRAPNGAERLTDLTWALNQAEVLDGSTTAVDIYRIPADPTAFEARGTGVLNPAPELLERRTESGSSDRDQFVEAIVTDALREFTLLASRHAALPPR